MDACAYGPQTLYVGWSWLVDDPLIIWGHSVKGQYHSDLDQERVVWSITVERLQPTISKQIGTFVMKSKLTLLMLMSSCQGHNDLEHKELVLLITKNAWAYVSQTWFGGWSWPINDPLCFEVIRSNVTMSFKRKCLTDWLPWAYIVLKLVMKVTLPHMHLKWNA